MIEINGLEGRAAADVLSRLAENVEVQAPMDEGKAAMLGGVVSGGYRARRRPCGSDSRSAPAFSSAVCLARSAAPGSERIQPLCGNRRHNGSLER
jgi:hypothetical protein